MSAAALREGGAARPNRRIGDRLAQIWATPGWILRAEADGLDFVLRPREKSGALPDGAAIAGLAGADRFALVLPQALLDQLLAQAPDPLRAGDLAAEDAAIVFEHFMGGALGGLERFLAEPISFEQVLPAGGLTDQDAMTFEIMTPDAAYPCALFLPGRETRARIARALDEIVSWGPAVMPGQALVIGPVALDPREARSLRVGDTVLIEGASTERLSGAILYPDGSGRPVTLENGAAVFAAGPIATAAERAALGSLDVVVGATTAPTMPRPGASASFRANPDQQVQLRLAGENIALGDLVAVDGRVGVTVTALREAP